MKVRIIAHNFIVPRGTILDVGDAPPLSWSGKWEAVKEEVKRDPLDHDGDGRKGGVAWKARG